MSRAAHLEEAAEHARKGRWAKAIDAYRIVLTEEPDNAELRVALADAYKRVKNDERAFHHYHRAAQRFIAKGDLTRAANALIEANAITPNVPDVLWRLCESLKGLRHDAELVPYLVTLIRAAPAPGDRRRLWALEELFLLHPDDLSVTQQRAEALFEAGRVDDAVHAYKKLASRLGQREAELVQVLFRAAKMADGRPDLGTDIAGVLLAHGRAKDALAVIVGFYEKAPDDLGVLETLVRSLDALGADEKALAARIELVKARAAAGSRSQVLAEVDTLLSVAPEDPVALEVSAHALALVREPARAQDTWRRLLRVAERRNLKGERERAIAAILKANPDDEDALELAIQVHAVAARFQESDALRQRLNAVRALKKRSLMPAPAKLENKRVLVPPASSSPLGSAGLPEPEDEQTGTMMLSDEDVVGIRGSGERIHDEVPERSDTAPRPAAEATRPVERADTVRPSAPPAPSLGPKAKTPSPTDPPLPSNPWFDGQERRAASTTRGLHAADRRAPTPPVKRRPTAPSMAAREVSRTDELAAGVRERRARFPDPASYGPAEDLALTNSAGMQVAALALTSPRTLPPDVDSATLPAPDHDEEPTWEADEPTAMDTRAVKHLRSLTENVAVQDLSPSLPGELTHPGFATQPALLPDIVDDLEDEP